MTLEIEVYYVNLSPDKKKVGGKYQETYVFRPGIFNC